ncbi:15812_t:CDS:1 [Dentiscutata erythropus]|uniref:15812_t:CDS:1 n=1 Tax=Dentiscutata erythropus TaxID=1348616 RepID=A0A9N9H615_9GLOM|nr:15812_t:CDS:1 [Dentiscutata erythropus]
MSANCSMHAGSWTKLTLTELKDLCAACGLSVENNKEELGKRLHAYFDKRRDKGPEVQLKRSNRRQELGPRNADDRTGKAVDVDLDEDIGGEVEDDLDKDSQKADNRIREEFAACFRGKEKVKSVPADVFLIALNSIKRKMDRNFSALYREIEEGDVLDEAWPKVKLSRPRNQHEYDFLAKIGKCLDKTIRMLPESNRKEIVGVREKVESRAATLRLADNRG